MKKYNKNIGKIGENLAEQFLKNIGYKIVERNFQSKKGEIDIIARDKKEIVFVEVKTRTILEYGNPAEAVNNIKKGHIYKAAEYYLLIHDKLEEYTRIDVIEVYLNKNNVVINHIKKAVT